MNDKCIDMNAHSTRSMRREGTSLGTHPSVKSQCKVTPVILHGVVSSEPLGEDSQVDPKVEEQLHKPRSVRREMATTFSSLLLSSLELSDTQLYAP